MERPAGGGGGGGGKAAPGTRPFLIAQYVAPWLKNGSTVTFATPIRRPSAPVPWTASAIWVYSVCTVAVGVIRVESPPLVPFVAAPSTSLFPAHTLTKVGCAATIA